MFKSKIYNVAIDPAKNSKYGKEQAELHSFRDSKYRNVGFIYDSRESAVRARNAMDHYIRRAQLPLALKQAGDMLVVTRRKA